MKDTQLNEVLKRAAVPEPGADYWERFPNQVTAEIERRRAHAGAASSADSPAGVAGEPSSAWEWVSALRSLVGRPAFVIGVAVACVAMGFVLGFWKGQPAPVKDAQLAEARKYYHELEALFPNQLQGIVFDREGAHLVLAPEADLPASPPLYVKICGPKGCQRFVTFSGQQIRVNGDLCDVLTDSEGHVLVVGRQVVWSSAQPVAKAGRYTIEAKPLQTTS